MQALDHKSSLLAPRLTAPETLYSIQVCTSNINNCVLPTPCVRFTPQQNRGGVIFSLQFVSVFVCVYVCMCVCVCVSE